MRTLLVLAFLTAGATQALTQGHSGPSPRDCDTPRYCIFHTYGFQSDSYCGYSDQEIKARFYQGCARDFGGALNMLRPKGTGEGDCQKFVRQGHCFDPAKGWMRYNPKTKRLEEIR